MNQWINQTPVQKKVCSFCAPLLFTLVLFLSLKHPPQTCSMQAQSEPRQSSEDSSQYQASRSNTFFFFEHDFYGISASVDWKLFQTHSQEKQAKIYKWGTTAKIAFIAYFEEIQFHGLTTVHDTDWLHCHVIAQYLLHCSVRPDATFSFSSSC